MRFIILNIALILSVGLFAQKENKYIRSGNNLYAEENYKEAEVDYMKALEANPASNKGQFNLGDALYKQESYEDAAKIFNNQAELLSDKTERSDAYYNLGNSMLKDNKLPESIEAYKKALRNNPKNMEAKYNMEYAKQKLEQQQEQDKEKKDDKKDDKKQDDKKQDKEKQDKEKQDKEKQDKEKQDKEKQDKEKQDKEDQQKKKQDEQDGDQNQEKQQQPQPQQISKKDAQRMLEALKDNEKKTLEKLKLQKMKAGNSKKVEKDW